MKIAILSFFSGHTERGVENWAKDLALRLGKRYKVSIYQNFPGNSSDYNVISNAVSVDMGRVIERQGILRKAFLDYWSLAISKWTVRVLPSIWREKPEIVIPTNGGWQVAIVRTLTWLYGGKMVIVGHSGKGWDERNNLWSFPDTFVALTKDAADWAKKVNPFISVEVIHDGVDTKVFDVKRASLDVELPKPIVLAVGALEKSKRLDLAIEAVCKLKKGNLLILGDGPERVILEKLGKNKLGKRFLIKSVKHDDMPKYYQAADVFTLPSWGSEAFGMVYLEAMACGLPVIATADPVRREIIDEAGILVNPENVEEYSNGLHKALKINWGNKPRHQAEKFSWEVVAVKYETLFSKLLN